MNTLLWIGAIIGIVGFTIGLVYYGSERFEEKHTLYLSLTNGAMILYLICAYLILKPILWEKYNLGGRMAVAAEAFIMLFFIIIARAIRAARDRKSK